MYLFSIFLTLVALFLVVATTCFIIPERLGIFLVLATVIQQIMKCPGVRGFWGLT